MKNYRLTLLALLNAMIVMVVVVTIRQFAPAEIIFYQLIATSLVVTLFFAVCVSVLSKRTASNLATLVQACVFSMFISYSCFITVPALLDRSISLYLLRLLETEQSSASLPELNAWYIDGFVVHNEAVLKRLDEQVFSGNIEFEEGCYNLATRGQLILWINDIFVSIFNTDRRYSMPQNYKSENWQSLSEMHTCQQ